MFTWEQPRKWFYSSGSFVPSIMHNEMTFWDRFPFMYPLLITVLRIQRPLIKVGFTVESNSYLTNGYQLEGRELLFLELACLRSFLLSKLLNPLENSKFLSKQRVRKIHQLIIRSKFWDAMAKLFKYNALIQLSSPSMRFLYFIFSLSSIANQCHSPTPTGCLPFAGQNKPEKRKSWQQPSTYTEERFPERLALPLFNAPSCSDNLSYPQHCHNHVLSEIHYLFPEKYQ